MTIAEIAQLARFIGSFRRLDEIVRVQDMVLRLTLREFGDYEAQGSEKLAHMLKESNILTESGSCELYLDMTKSTSHAFIAPHEILGSRHYGAPFDIALSRLARAHIIHSALHNEDRILRLELERVSSYKRERIIMQCEFSGKHTNVILLAPPESSAKAIARKSGKSIDGIVIEALRHISPAQSCRPVRVGAPLSPMPPNPRAAKYASTQALDCSNALILESSAESRRKCTLDSGRESTQNTAQTPVLIDFARALQQRYVIEQDRTREALRALLIAHYSRSLERTQQLLDSLPKAHELEARSAMLYRQANALLCVIHTLKPYQRSVCIDGEHIEIPPESTPQIAINGRFKEAKRLAKKSQNIHKEAQNLTSKIDFLAHQLDFIATTQSLETLQLLSPKPSIKPTKPAKASKEPKSQVLFIQGFKLSIGRNERENQALLQAARADDMWLHVRDVPSSHMIIHCGKHKVPESVLHKAGEILLGVSGLNKGDFCVDYTKRKFVKITHGAQVLYTKAQSLHY